MDHQQQQPEKDVSHSKSQSQGQNKHSLIEAAASLRMQRLNNDAIMMTADDAIQSKLSAVNKGYYKDPFVHYLSLNDDIVSSISNAVPQQTKFDDDDIDYDNLGSNQLLLRDRTNRRRMRMDQHQHQHQHQQGGPGRGRGRDQQHQPLIRRGTFARYCVIDYAISTFLSLCHEKNTAVSATATYEDGKYNEIDYDTTNTNNENDSDSDNFEEDVQIVILGSGRDTSYLRAKCGLLHGNDDAKTALEEGIMENVRWYEIDHEEVILTKQKLLSACPLLDLEYEKFQCQYHHHRHQRTNGNSESTSESESASEASHNTSFAIRPKAIHTSIPRTTTRYRPDNKFKLKGTGMMGLGLGIAEDPPLQPKEAQYHLIGYDLCNPFNDLLEILETKHSFSLSAPTLFVMECVQMYIPDKESRSILDSITALLQQPFIALFDPIIQNDSFGQVMAKNLTKAKIITNPSMSLLVSKTLQSQIEKLFHSGFRMVTGCDFMTAYETIISGDDRKRANMVEMLDEIEEWVLIMKHYCFVVAGGSCKDSNTRRIDNNSDSRYIALLKRFCSSGDNGSLGFRDGRCTTVEI